MDGLYSTSNVADHSGHHARNRRSATPESSRTTSIRIDQPRSWYGLSCFAYSESHSVSGSLIGFPITGTVYVFTWNACRIWVIFKSTAFAALTAHALNAGADMPYCCGSVFGTGYSDETNSSNGSRFSRPLLGTLSCLSSIILTALDDQL